MGSGEERRETQGKHSRKGSDSRNREREERKMKKKREGSLWWANA